MAKEDVDFNLLHEIVTLQRESNDRDTRIESKMDSMNTRMEVIEKHSEKQDQQIEKITEILSNQKTLARDYSDMTQLIKGHERRITDLEQKDAKNALAIWKKIGGIALTVVITSVVGFIMGRFI